MRESLRFEGKILSATVSKVAGHWYAIIAVETASLSSKLAKNHGKVGIDLGVNTSAVLWTDDGTHEAFMGLGPRYALLPKLRVLARLVSRKVKGSTSREKARLKLARLHARIANIRKDTMHKLTSHISRNYSTAVIEDLNVRGMLQRSNRGLGRSIADMGFHEFRRQLEYKMDARGGQIIVANRYFASSKTCSHCGNVFKQLKQGQTSWTCATCNTLHDCDVNAAHNLWKVV